jgi:hypothetical protein
MPVILKMDFEDGSNQVLRIPAQVWRMNNKQIVKTLHFPKKGRAVHPRPVPGDGRHQSRQQRLAAGTGAEPVPVVPAADG